MAKNATNDPAAEQSDRESRAGETAQSNSGGGRLLLTVVLLIGLVTASASAAVLAALFIIRPAAAEQAAEEPAVSAEPEAESAPAEFAFDEDLIVNVYQTQQRRFLSVRPVFVLESKEGVKEMKAKKVEVQHLMIGILKGKTLEQLDEPQATNTIGREIADAVNAELDLKAKVQRVYFTQFVVQ